MHFWAVRKVAHHFIPLSCLSPFLNLPLVTQTLKIRSLFCKIFALCQVSLLVECPQVYWAAELHLVLDTWGPLCLLAPPRRPARDFTNAQTHNTKRQNNKTRTKISHWWWLESNKKKTTQKQWWKWGEQGNSGSNMSDFFYQKWDPLSKQFFELSVDQKSKS